MSQKFRNLRRRSQPAPTDGQVKSKIVTVQHATPLATFRHSSSLEEGDAADYEQNVQLLKNELSQASPDNNRIHQLLKLTHATRRRQTADGDQPAVMLKEDYPFLDFKKCVGVCFLLSFLSNSLIIYVHQGWEL